MPDTYQSEWGSSIQGTRISADHFGINAVSRDNNFSASGPFSEAIGALKPTSIRYPGGTVTEDLFDPNSSFWNEVFENNTDDVIDGPDGTKVATVQSFLRFADEQNHEVKFVLPTEHLLKNGPYGTRVIDEVALQKMMSKVDGLVSGDYGDVRIDTFEIGNEYYVNGRMTAEEYGMVANRVTLELADSFDEHRSHLPAGTTWEEPKIAVQAGAGWLPEDNDAIIGAFSLEARGEVDVVVAHFYPKTLESVENFGGLYKSLEAWNDAEGFSNLETWMSEWNVRNGETSDQGLYQASSSVAIFDEMIVRGVDSASIWGAQHQNLNSKLVSVLSHDLNSPIDDTFTTYATATGQIFSELRSDLIGLRSLDLDPDNFLNLKGGNDVDVHAFGNGGRAVVFISSRSDTAQVVDLDLDEYFQGRTHMHATSIVAVDDPRTSDFDESDPHSPNGRIAVHNLNNDELVSDDGKITLAPGQILKVEVNFQNTGVHLAGINPLDPLPTDDYNDHFVGSGYNDHVAGHYGDDTLEGLGGRDILYGGTGDDVVSGGGGTDFVSAGSGADHAFGGTGNDLVRGGNGNDTIFGGGGDDRLEGEEGDDSLFGGGGNDTLISADGANELTGGGGSDLYLMSVDSNTVIVDFDAATGDRISFMGHYEDEEHLDSRMTKVSNADGERSDIVILHETGNTTTILGAGDQIDLASSVTVDFSDEGRAAIALAHTLNDLSPTQIANYMGDLNTEEFGEQILSDHANTLLENLHPETAGAFFNGMIPDEVVDFLDLVDEDVLSSFVGNMDDRSVVQFLDQFDDESLTSFLDVVPEPVADLLENVLEQQAQQNAGEDGAPDMPTHLNDPIDTFPMLPPDKMDENDTADSNEDEDNFIAQSDCFVASAAYRDRHHPDVVLLRQFRETVLRNSVLGRRFIRFYWWIGPKLARPVYRHPTLRLISRLILSSIVKHISRKYGNRMFQSV